MISSLKSALRRALPQSGIERLRFVAQTLPRLPEAALTRRAFDTAAAQPAFLGSDDLRDLQAEYPPPAEYGYSPETVRLRGEERCAQLLRLPGAHTAGDVLELGCWDGMVSAALCGRGKRATAVDARSEGFDERARRQGVQLLQADAAALGLPDESFDFVFSYDAFEHFPDPQRVLDEALRVARPGAHVYLEFGPLYCSAYGLHAYRTVRVPYCQFLFSRQTLDDHADRTGVARIDYNDVNGLSLADYRAIWSRSAARAERVAYHETSNLSHLALIRSHPSCFKSKGHRFEDFTVSGISILLRKRGVPS